MKNSQDLQLSQLVDMSTPAAVFEEVKYNFIQYYPVSAFFEVRAAFNDFNLLFEGKYPHYRACNTKFHDKVHTTDALLAVSRLIDGYNIRRGKLPLEQVRTALIATIFHDTGYIQLDNDRKGTGAKYTLEHVGRSIGFMKEYFKRRAFPRHRFLSAGRMVSCTGLSRDLNKIKFVSKSERVLGFMLGSADLLGQMASRTYLERLLYLYREFREGNVKGYPSEIALFQKTLKFYEDTKRRLCETLKGVNKYVVFHFGKRYGADEDLYLNAIERQIVYLGEILECRKDSFRGGLRRRA